MAKQTINIGASPNDGTGTPLRTSFDYTNQNFTELYTALGGGVGLPGATTQVIFNDGGTNLAGDAGLVYNKTTDALTVGGLVTAGSATITGAATVGTTLGVTGVSTLASAVVTGALTVDTATLVVDPTNDRVGIGTTTPAYKLEVVAPAGNNIVSTFRSGDATAANNAGGGFQSISSATAASRVARVWLDADGADLSGGDYFFIQKNGNSGTVEFNQSSNAAMTFLTNGTERYRIASDGVATWSNVGGVAGTAMTLNATGLGVGVVPAAGDGSGAFKAAGTGSLTANSRVGLDVRELVSGNSAGIILGAMTTENTAVIGSRTGSGNIAFQTYNGASWGERMRIDYLGNLILQSPATPATLTTNGQLTVNATSNTNLRFSYRGSDGVTRVANITLA